MITRDEAFCDPCYNDLQNLMKRSTLISQTSEKQRNIFFSIVMNKIKDRKKQFIIINAAAMDINEIQQQLFQIIKNKIATRHFSSR